VLSVTEIVEAAGALLGTETEETIRSGPILMLELDLVLLLSLVSGTALSASARAIM
jgi:hypothetical protein